MCLPTEVINKSLNRSFPSILHFLQLQQTGLSWATLEYGTPHPYHDTDIRMLGMDQRCISLGQKRFLILFMDQKGSKTT